MARMHSRKKGKSGSSKPLNVKMPGWVRYKSREVELLVIKLFKEGETPSKIGVHLRDTYGIPSVKLICKKSVADILQDKNLLPEIPEDMMALIRKSVMLRKHLERNKKDQPAKRGLTLTESKIKRLVKYYKKSKKLPVGWKYDAKTLKLITE